MVGVIVAVVFGVLMLCGIASWLWDANAIAKTARECSQGNHRYCTSKSPWHPPGVPTGSGR
jgi:hypothetical protein